MTLSVSPVRHSYSIYGVRVTSDMPFAFPADTRADERRGLLADVAFVEADECDFDRFRMIREAEDRFVCHALPDGPIYLRWPHLYEFSVAADGSRVACRPIDGCDRSVFQNCLLGQVLGVALVRQGIEPLHAAVVRIDDYAVGFLGDCTFGKSTLLASFLDAGHLMLTDDLLMLERRGNDVVALPGSGRIKLLPDSASRVLKNAGVGVRLNPMTTKRSFPLDASQQQRSGLPLRLLFVLPDPDERDCTASIEIRRASGADMVHELLKNTFTAHIVDRDRLVRQFAHAAQVASDVDGFRLRYPSGLHHLPALRQAIVEHSRRQMAQRTS